ncbi:hypothetical protein [Falsiroseomonas sp. CW058]|uniref:hypothetical protein n=1 Tax=Falsiroseomonas sp. CW058 TaxID=3388664 RepID=UPI003D31FD41
MFSDLIAWIVAVFLLGPLQAEVHSKLEAARAPAAVMQGVTACAVAAAPGLADRAAADPWWAVTSVIGVWIGTTTPEAVLRDAAPSCAPALAAARPFLG